MGAGTAWDGSQAWGKIGVNLETVLGSIFGHRQPSSLNIQGVKVQFLLLMATSDRVEKWNDGQCTKVEVTFGEMLTECSATARNLFRLRVKLFLGPLTLVEQKRSRKRRMDQLLPAAAPGCHVEIRREDAEIFSPKAQRKG